MNKLNRLLSGLPILILVFWVVCLIFFIDLEEYRDLFYFLDRIDTIIVAASLLHAWFYWPNYSKISKYFTRAIMALVMIRIIYNPSAGDSPRLERLYYFAYFFIILQTILESIRVNLKAK